MTPCNFLLHTLTVLRANERVSCCVIAGASSERERSIHIIKGEREGEPSEAEPHANLLWDSLRFAKGFAASDVRSEAGSDEPSEAGSDVPSEAASDVHSEAASEAEASASAKWPAKCRLCGFARKPVFDEREITT